MTISHFCKGVNYFYKINLIFFDFFMRLDKFLKVSRILKRRNVAKDACDGGKVLVNEKSAKPSHQLKIGDIVEIFLGGGSIKFKIVSLKETVKKEEAETLYEIVR